MCSPVPVVHSEPLRTNSHLFFVTEKSKFDVDQSVDKYGDSFARDVSVEELRTVRIHNIHLKLRVSDMTKMFESMPSKSKLGSTTMDFRSELREHDHDLGQLPGWMFEGLLLLVVHSDQAELHNHSTSNSQSSSKSHDLQMKRACNLARFAGADLTADMNDDEVTHVIVGAEANTRAVRQKMSRYGSSCSQ